MRFYQHATNRELARWLATARKARKLVTCERGHAECGCSTVKTMDGRAPCSMEAAAEREHRTKPGVRYLTVICPSPQLVMLRVPTIGEDIAIKPWRKVLRAFNPIREDVLKVAWSEVFSIECAGDEPPFMEKAGLAYEGDVGILPAFALYDWRDDAFVLVRASSNKPSTT